MGAGLPDLNTDGEVRHVDAVDTDGRLYRLTRHRDRGQVVVAVDDDPAEADPPTRAPLTDLHHATTAPQPVTTAAEGHPQP